MCSLHTNTESGTGCHKTTNYKLNVSRPKFIRNDQCLSSLLINTFQEHSLLVNRPIESASSSAATSPQTKKLIHSRTT